MTKTIKLNDLHLVLLCAAAQRKNGSLLPAPKSVASQEARIRKAIPSLIRQGLVEETPVTNAKVAWREEDGTHISLVITETGREAIGAGDAHEAAAAPASAIVPDDVMPASSAASPSPPVSKIAQVIALLTRTEGATLDELVRMTGWLPHTTRAALTGLRKKGHGIAREKRGDMTCYRIVAGA